MVHFFLNSKFVPYFFQSETVGNLRVTVTDSKVLSSEAGSRGKPAT